MKIKETYKPFSINLKSGNIIDYYKIPMDNAMIIQDKYDGALVEKISDKLQKIYLLNNGWLLLIIRNKFAELYKSLHDFTICRKDAETSFVEVEAHRYFINSIGKIEVVQQIFETEIFNYLNQLNLNFDKINNGVFELANSQILVFIKNGRSLLFKDEIQYHAYNKSKKRHPLKGLNEDKENILFNLSTVIANLANALNIPLEKLDKSYESLAIIDENLILQKPYELFFLNNIFSIILYFGEVYIHEKGGKWFFREESDLWIPAMMNSADTEIQPWHTIYEALSPTNTLLLPLSLIFSRY